jgi:hypothetical protein
MQTVDVWPNFNVTFDMQTSTKWQGWADIYVECHIDVSQFRASALVELKLSDF